MRVCARTRAHAYRSASCARADACALLSTGYRNAGTLQLTTLARTRARTRTRTRPCSRVRICTRTHTHAHTHTHTHTHTGVRWMRWQASGCCRDAGAAPHAVRVRARVCSMQLYVTPPCGDVLRPCAALMVFACALYHNILTALARVAAPWLGHSLPTWAASPTSCWSLAPRLAPSPTAPPPAPHPSTPRRRCVDFFFSLV